MPARARIDNGKWWVEDRVVREHVFLSHANPEDDEFARWLALRLSVEGYVVWCDLTQLLGGEDFWADIEEGIRRKTAKFVYILSGNSNRKPGPLKELHLAQQVARSEKLRDFVIPLRIDDLPHDQFNIRLASLNAIDFHSWHLGLNQLLTKLEKDRVPRPNKNGPEAAAAWWNANQIGSELISPEPQHYVSNWFRISGLPETIYCHELLRDGIGPVTGGIVRSSCPALRHGVHIISFASRNQLDVKLEGGLRLGRQLSFKTEAFAAGEGPWSERQRRSARDVITYLLTDGWIRELVSRGLKAHEMAHATACYFPKGLTGPSDVVPRSASDLRRGRQVVGHKTMFGKSRRYWHFAVQARAILHPEPAMVISTHVLFSDDGESVWRSAQRLHAARRSQCKDWWNDDWRDRLLGAMAWCANGTKHLNLSLAPSASARVEAMPMRFYSPIRYSDVDAVVGLEDEAYSEDDADEGNE